VKLLVGLGNPGRKYEGTRHNVGFDVLNLLAERGGNPNRRQRFQGETSQTTIRGTPALLLWPLTWMNLSGGSVLAARDFYKLDLTDILVICDDFQLPLNTIRMRLSGSAGGQKGLADTIARLSSTAIPRLRVGIGPVPKHQDPPSFVLGKFTKYEQSDLNETIHRAADAVESWVTLGIETTMNRYN
jgi:peptidyl-tRNA hydrolase, PTH1 family